MAINQTQIDKVVQSLKSHGATRLILFGSVLDNPDEARDLDIAVDGIGGWELLRLNALLEQELLILIDIVSLTPKNPFINYVEKTGRVIYEV